MVGAQSAQAANLYHCDPSRSGYTYVCTTVTSAPSSGVRVHERNFDYVKTLYNGNSVVLLGWGHDQYGRCGVNGDPYVWRIGWYDRHGWNVAMVGDYYVATGSRATWGSRRTRGADSTTRRTPWGAQPDPRRATSSPSGAADTNSRGAAPCRLSR